MNDQELALKSPSPWSFRCFYIGSRDLPNQRDLSRLNNVDTVSYMQFVLHNEKKIKAAVG